MDFVRNIHNSFGAKGDQFLSDLPALIDEAAGRWDLTVGRPFALSYNYVAAAKRADGTEVVLKIGVPDPELISEIEALRVYAGQGAVRLIDADIGKGLLLEERVVPGSMLAELGDDEQATEIAATLMRSLWRPVPEQNRFIRLRDWFDGLRTMRRTFGGGSGPFPKKMVETVEGLLVEFFAEAEPPVVLHGDFHHYNVLRAGTGWQVIDPKGVVGPRAYEVGPLLINPFPQFLRGTDAKQRTERRIGILSEQLGFERARILGWALSHAVLSSWWHSEDDETGAGGEYSLACAELFMSMRQ